MGYEQITFEVSDWIATVTLNRPDKLNAWTMQMEREYRAALLEAEERDDVRVIIVTGAGRGFCAGADMSLLTAVQSGDLNLDETTGAAAEPGSGPGVPEDFRKPYSFPPGIPKPIIAAVNGHAMGIGLVHALYCDFRFASDQAKFGTAFVQRGLIAEHGMCWLLPRLVGLENAMDLLFSGRIIPADEAQRIGLVGRVVPHDQLLAEARAYATHLATRCSPRSIAIMKRQVWDSQLRSLAPSVEVAIKEMFDSFGSADFLEGVSSFLEKRPPNFTGK